MSEKQENLIVVLDVGSAWTRVLAADVNEGALRYRGHGLVESTGMRKGLISELRARGQGRKAGERASGVDRARQHRSMRGGRRWAAHSRTQYEWWTSTWAVACAR